MEISRVAQWRKMQILRLGFPIRKTVLKDRSHVDFAENIKRS